MRICLILILFGLKTASGQSLKLSEGTHWMMYDPHLKMYAFSMDSLSHYKHMALDDDTLSRYLSSVQVWPKDKWSVWQGYYFCSADFPDSGTTVIIFSSHGGFFYDIKHKQYYCVTDDLRDSFTAYFINKLKAYYGKGN